MWQQKLYFQAIITRDSRFDGKFYYGVKTTGIYCRPVCPAKPKIENIELFLTKDEALKAGYRPCKRCFSSNYKLLESNAQFVLQHALLSLQKMDISDFNEEQFAANYSISKRHLRRVFIKELGKTPIQILKEKRMQTVLKFMQETPSTLTDLAFASGFQSLRRFNSAIKEKFKMTPSKIRKTDLVTTKESTKFLLLYKKPYDFIALLNFYRSHQVNLLEEYSQYSMQRIFQFAGEVGRLTLENNIEKSALELTIFFKNYNFYPEILSRIKGMFDIEFDPIIIDSLAHKNPKLAEIFKLYPGIRMPSGWDSFEISIATILGQLVSVKRGKSLVNELIELVGNDSGLFKEGKSIKLFPSPEQILLADLSALKTTNKRKQTLKDFCAALVNRQISLESEQSMSEFSAKILEIKGIGKWTAQYIALRALRDVNSFPKTDLILSRALKNLLIDDIDNIAPWRAYAAAVLWQHFGKK